MYILLLSYCYVLKIKSKLYYVLLFRHLKPYILRDSVTKPLWLQMLNELKEHFRLKKGLPTRAEVETIDYSYVRANHIKSVNALARQFFWPGIDCKFFIY